MTNIVRRALIKLGGSGLLLAPLTALAGPLLPTARQGRGPFYPVELPLDSDNDLLWIEGHDEPATGTPTNVIGRVLSQRGQPLAGARVEIWQCNAHGRYHHPADEHDAPLDEHFQAFGSTVTDAEGRYRFRTIKPVAYPGRVPHIHFRVVSPAGEELTTQLYMAGQEGLDEDGVFRRIEGDARRQAVQAVFGPNPDDSATLLAEWDVVMA